MTSGPLHQAALTYYTAGWRGIIPWTVGEGGRKQPALAGVTGHQGQDLDSPEQLLERMALHGHHQLGLRLPDDVIVIDVDHYGDKRGADTIAALEQRLGPLPPTWSSTSKGDGPSRQHFYRAPGHVGQRYRDPGEDVEVLQRQHRFAAVWPSIHPNGQPYRWYPPAGYEWVQWRNPDLPHIDDLTVLPQAWHEHLLAGPQQAAREHQPYTGAVYGSLTVVEQDANRAWADYRVGATLAALATRLEGEAWNKALIDAALTLRTLAADGWSGLSETDLFDRYLAAVPDDHGYAEQRWQDAGRQIGRPSGAGIITPPTAADLLGMGAGQQPVAPAAQAQAWSLQLPAPTVFEASGTDSTLATAVLEHHAGHLRYAVDAGAWLHRVESPSGGHRWQIVAGGVADAYARGLANACGQLMAYRDTGDPSDEPHNKARARLLSAAGCGAVATLMAAHLSRPGHPLAVTMANLDDEPHLLWCNGTPYDLRVATPTVGQSRHVVALRDTNLTPDPSVPTPRFDRYLATVIPDPELRAWAMRLFGVAVTGHPDRTLPILHGQPDSGKSSLIGYVMRALGEYAGPVDARLLGAGEHHGSLFLALRGLRLAYIDEGPRKGRNAAEKLKYLTGGTKLTGNAMRQDPVEFAPTHTLVMSCNDDPEVADDGLRSRFRPVRCDTPRETVVPALMALEAVWETEAPGVLAKLIAEAAAWLADRSSSLPPAGVAVELERMGREQEPVTAWLDQRAAPALGDELTPNDELYRDFRNWYTDAGLPLQAMPSADAWGRRLTRLGHASTMGKVGEARDRRCRALYLVQRVGR